MVFNRLFSICKLAFEISDIRSLNWHLALWKLLFKRCNLWYKFTLFSWMTIFKCFQLDVQLFELFLQILDLLFALDVLKAGLFQLFLQGVLALFRLIQRCPRWCLDLVIELALSLPKLRDSRLQVLNLLPQKCLLLISCALYLLQLTLALHLLIDCALFVSHSVTELLL